MQQITVHCDQGQAAEITADASGKSVTCTQGTVLVYNKGRHALNLGESIKL
jgi:hypothetical protein